MNLRPKLPPRHHATLASAPSTAPMATVPAWLRWTIPDAQSLAGKDVEDLALTAGAAIGALDAVVRRQERWAGAWRQRLALVAAALTAKQAGRVEDEGALRDAVLLTRPGDFLSISPAEEWLTRHGYRDAVRVFRSVDLLLARSDFPPYESGLAIGVDE